MGASGAGATPETHPAVKPSAGQRRRGPGDQVLVINRVDYEQGLAWAHREADGYPAAKGEGIAIELVEAWPVCSETTIVLRYAEVPVTINDPKSGYKSGSKYTGHSMQKRWREHIFMPLLLVQRAKLPKHPVPWVRVRMTLYFAKGHARDPENYRVVPSKAFADALVQMRVLKDDRGTAFQLVDFRLEKGERDETVIELTWPNPN